MDWNTAYPFSITPTLEQIAAFIANPLWDRMRGAIETDYSGTPKIEHSRCGMVPGWNLKYKKGGKAICTLYPNGGFFSCMVVIPAVLQTEAEQLLEDCTRYTRELYHNTKPGMGGRWLFMDVINEDILEDALRLIHLRLCGRK